MATVVPLVESTVQKVIKFVEEVRQQGVPIQQAYLFGSYAKGTPGEWSDVDVALVSDVFTGVRFEDIKRFVDVTIRAPYILFEVHTFNTTDFEENDAFAQEIINTGVRVC